MASPGNERFCLSSGYDGSTLPPDCPIIAFAHSQVNNQPVDKVARVERRTSDETFGEGATVALLACSSCVSLAVAEVPGQPPRIINGEARLAAARLTEAFTHIQPPEQLPQPPIAG